MGRVNWKRPSGGVKEECFSGNGLQFQVGMAWHGMLHNTTRAYLTQGSKQAQSIRCILLSVQLEAYCCCSGCWIRVMASMRDCPKSFT